MNVLLFGASGMIGQGVLLECLDDPLVTRVVAVGRSACGVTHPKLEEIRHDDFTDLSPIAARLRDFDACFYCLGTSSAGMSEAEYTRVTYDVTVAVLGAVARESPGATVCFVSGQGTDATEQGHSMWARVKGRAENAVRKLPFRSVYLFRPGFIQPLRGIRSKTALYRGVYTVLSPLFPLLERVAPSSMTTTERVGLAMLRVAREGHPDVVLETPAINALGARPT